MTPRPRPAAMSRYTPRIRFTLTAIAATLLVAAAPSVALAQHYTEEFRLREGENHRDWVFEFFDSSAADLNGRVAGDHEVLVFDAMISPTCRSAWELQIYEGGMPVHRGPEYRTVLLGGGSQQHAVEIEPVRVNDSTTPPYLRDCEVAVRLWRPLNFCTMSAKVSGDLAGNYFGDFAYFNYFPEGAPITTGNALDPETVALLDQLTGGGGFADAIRQWAAESEAAGEDPVPGAGDKFGITLVGITAGSGGFGDEVSPDGLAGAISETLNALSSFSLTASSPGDELDGPMSDVGPGNYTEGQLPLSVVQMMPGDKDANLEGVKFVGQDGNPGSAYMEVAIPSPNVILGLLKADLMSVQRYQGRRLRVHVEASFQARRGALSCNEQ